MMKALNEKVEIHTWLREWDVETRALWKGVVSSHSSAMNGDSKNRLVSIQAWIDVSRAAALYGWAVALGRVSADTATVDVRVQN